MEGKGDQTLNDKANTEARLLKIVSGVCGRNLGPHNECAQGPAITGNRQACGLVNRLNLPKVRCTLFRVQIPVAKTCHLATATAIAPPELEIGPGKKIKLFPQPS